MREARGVTALPTTGEFIGRKPELERVGELILGPARLITLIGSGGIGKTHLAMEAVHRVRKAARLPVYWVRLARLAKGASAPEVEGEIVRSVVEPDFSGRPAWQALVDTLARSDTVGHSLPTVLVLDNCEHVLDGVAPLIGELIDAVPGLSIVATSREPIGWVDERLVAIPPLSRTQALELFRRRAEAIGVTLTAEQSTTAERICRHLHNHPLSIRLAAARLRHQPLPTILRDVSGERTDRRLRWPPGPRVGADERHQGIGDIIGWSYDLCGPQERLLFERLSVFAAGYDLNPEDATNAAPPDMGIDLEAIEAVCADPAPGGLVPEEVEPLLERLVDRSLVSIHLGAETARYSLLENFQVFAQQQLLQRAPDEWEQLVCRHRRYYRDKVVQARNEWFGTREQDLLAWAHGAWGNLLSAVDRSLTTPGEAVIGLEIASGLIALRLPFFIGTLRESRTLAERALEATREPGHELAEPQISAMVLIGWVSLCQGLPGDAARVLDDCVAACIPDPSARPVLRQDPTTDLGLPAGVDYLWGSILLLAHNDPRAATVLGRAREKFTAAGTRGGAIMSELFEAMSVGFHGDRESALEISAAHLAHAAESGAEWVLAWAELASAIALAIHADPYEAAERAHSALSRQAEMKEHWGTTWGVHIRAWILAREITDGVSPARARELAFEIARLTGGATTLRRRVGVDLEHLRPFAAQTDRAVETARGVLGEQTFETAFREGEALDSAKGEVIRLALGTLSMSEPAAGAEDRRSEPALWQRLTDAEREVAVLAAAGWTNPAIAARRGSSYRTVDAQLSAVLHKLLITSRTGIAHLVPEEQQERVRLESTRRPRHR